MPPFQYKTFVDPYVGSIAQLMGQQGERQADAAERIAAIRAQEALQRGEIWGGAIQGIGNLAADTMTEWNSPEARRQRELDKARKIIRTGSDRVRQVEDRRYQEGDSRLDMGSIGSTIENLRPTVTTGTMFGDTAPTEAELDAMQAGQIQPSGQASYSSAAKPDITVGARDPGMVQGDPYIETLTREIKGYLTDDGFFDPRRAMADLSAGGISQSVINEMMSDLSGNNEMLAAWDALETKNDDDETVLFGRLAATAIKQSDSGVLPINSAIALNLEPLELRFGKEAINDLRVQLIGLPPDQQKSVLMDAVKAADDILGYDVFTQGQGQVSKITGEAVFPAGIDPVTEAQTAVLEATRSGDPDKIASSVDALVNVSSPMSSFQIEIKEAELGLKRGTLAEAIAARKEKAALDARTQDERERAALRGEELTERELSLRYPTTVGQGLSTYGDAAINIQDAMRELGLTPVTEDEKLFNRVHMGMTGPVSWPMRATSEFLGTFQGSYADDQAVDLAKHAIVRAMQNNTRLPDRERQAVSASLDMEAGALRSPRTLRTRFREIDKQLRLLLQRRTQIDDVGSILQAIDLLGVTSDEAPAGTVLLWRDGEAYEIPQGDVERAIAGGFSRSKE
jgi:hypothetical protein